MTKAKPKTTDRKTTKLANLIEQLPAFIGHADPDLVAAIKGEKPKKD